MANQEHLDILRQGVEVWNKWIEEHHDIQGSYQIDLSNADLEGMDLPNIELTRANLANANLARTNLYDAQISESNLRNVNLYGANLAGANLLGTDMREANLEEASFEGAMLANADLRGATLHGANLQWATLVEVDFGQASLVNCWVFAASVWDVNLEGAEQEDLFITFQAEPPKITVDNLEIAQFIYLLLKNSKIRQVFDTITSKVVLILGSFAPERKRILDALRDKLRYYNYSPVVFDFKKPASRDFTETVRTLAHMSKFILADLTDPSSIPQELQAIVPDLAVPIQPLLEESKREYAMFIDFRKYHWVLPTYFYKDQATLLASLKTQIIDQVEGKVEEIALEKARILESRKKRN